MQTPSNLRIVPEPRCVDCGDVTYEYDRVCEECRMDSAERDSPPPRPPLTLASCLLDWGWTPDRVIWLAYRMRLVGLDAAQGMHTDADVAEALALLLDRMEQR